VISPRIACISLWQPWASLLIQGPKIHETRSWAPPEALIGQRFVIHAAKKAPGPRKSNVYVPLLLERLAYARNVLPYAQPLGVALGTAVLVSAYPVEEHGPENGDDRVCGDWSDGRWAWRFDDRRAFEKPVPIRGRQRIWYEPLEGELARAIEAAA